MFLFFCIFFLLRDNIKQCIYVFLLLHWTPVALKESIFDFNRNINIIIWKKHDVWIVPWTSSQLFVPRLNEKSIPGPRIKQKPPFLSSLPPNAIVFMYRLIKRQRKKLKQRKLISGRFFSLEMPDYKKASDVNSLLNRTSKWEASKESSNPHAPNVSVHQRAK